MNSVFPWGGSHIGISRILSCAAVNILPMVEMLGPGGAVHSTASSKQKSVLLGWEALFSVDVFLTELRDAIALCDVLAELCYAK